MAKEGSKRVEIAGLDDKRQITAVFGCTMAGDFLPSQLIYQGTTKKCFPSSVFPLNWNITFSENYWLNESTMVEYIDKILLPYTKIKQEKLALSTNHQGLVIFNRFRGQCTDAIFAMLEANHAHFVIVPSYCTDRLRPLDVNVNRAAKEFLRNEFQE